MDKRGTYGAPTAGLLDLWSGAAEYSNRIDCKQWSGVELMEWSWWNEFTGVEWLFWEWSAPKQAHNITDQRVQLSMRGEIISPAFPFLRMANHFFFDSYQKSHTALPRKAGYWLVPSGGGPQESHLQFHFNNLESRIWNLINQNIQSRMFTMDRWIHQCNKWQQVG